MTWRYLCEERCVPEATIRAAIRHDLVREGPPRQYVGRTP
ncbi:DUF3991 domain-containing protein [Agrobacterium tumefaciens]